MADQDTAKLKIVEALYAATGAGDWAGAEHYLTDDFFIIEADGLPFAGIYRGKSALHDLFIKVMGMMDVKTLDITQTTIGGEYAVTLVSFVFQDANLKPSPLAEMFRFRGDKICEIRPYYFDPALIIAACDAKRRAS